MRGPVRDFFVLEGAFAVGELSWRAPSNLWGLVFGLCLAFLTGLAAARLLAPGETARRRGMFVVTGVVFVGTHAGRVPFDAWGAVFTACLALLVGIAEGRLLREGGPQSGPPPPPGDDPDAGPRAGGPAGAAVS